METIRTVQKRNAQSLLDWVGREDASVQELLAWCYFGFGRSRESEAPHLQLISALPINGDSYSIRKRLATLVAGALTQWPDLAVRYPGNDEAPESLIYDLLSLAGRLDCPEVLFEPLWQVRARLRNAGKQLPQMARLALTKALIQNQESYHPELLAVWKRLTKGESDAVLGGPPEVGMEGIGMMPAKDAGECPEREAVSEGLLALAERYAADQRSRRQRFRAQLIWLQQLWGLPAEYYIFLADEYKWVERGYEWTVVAFPELFVPSFVAETKPDERGAFVSRWFAGCLEPWTHVNIEQEFCGERVLLVTFLTQTSRQFDYVLQQVKGLANFHAEISEEEANLYLFETMGRFVRDLQKTNAPAARRLEATRREFCQTAIASTRMLLVK